jgi:hypothetical protein
MSRTQDPVREMQETVRIGEAFLASLTPAERADIISGGRGGPLMSITTEPAPWTPTIGCWYFYLGTPVYIHLHGGIIVMRGYNFATKEEFRTPVEGIPRDSFTPIHT